MKHRFAIAVICLLQVLLLTMSASGQTYIQRFESNYQLKEIPPQYKDSLLNAVWPPVADYPAKAKPQGLRTVVWVRIVVGANGRPVDATAKPSAYPGLGFEEAAAKGAMNSVFRPRWDGPYPIEYSGYYPLIFDDPGKEPHRRVEAVPFGIGYEAPVITPTEPLKLTFPPKALMRLVEAQVWLKILVNRRGEVSHAEIEKRTVQGLGFDEIALKAVKQATFPIKVVKDRPEEYRAFVLADFRLTDDQLLALQLPLLDRPNSVDVGPKYLSSTHINFPDELRNSEFTGYVNIASLVDTNGQVLTARIDTSSGNSMLDALALLNARERVYEPATNKGKKAMAWIRHYIDYPPGASPRAMKAFADSMNEVYEKEGSGRRVILATDEDESTSTPPEIVRQAPAFDNKTGDIYENVQEPDSLARITKFQKARYPAAEYDGGVQGTAKLAALIDNQGTPLRIQLVRSSGNENLDTAALTATQGHKFRPGKIGNKPVKSWVSWLVKFEPGSKEVLTPEQAKAENTGLVLPETERVVTPKMPEDALRKGHFGTVWLEIKVNENGKVADAKVSRSSGFAELDSAAMSVAKLDSFKPATYKGKPCSFSTRYRVVFAKDNK